MKYEKPMKCHGDWMGRGGGSSSQPLRNEYVVKMLARYEGEMAKVYIHAVSYFGADVTPDGGLLMTDSRAMGLGARFQDVIESIRRVRSA
jgi:hypothetical protein